MTGQLHLIWRLKEYRTELTDLVHVVRLEEDTKVNKSAYIAQVDKSTIVGIGIIIFY